MTVTENRFRIRARAGWKTRGEEVRVGIDCKPFQIPRCTNTACRAPLADEQGNPRWDLLEGRFVCLGACKPKRAAAARKAALS